MTSPDQLVIGRIGRPHGLRGGVTIEVRTDDPDTRFAEGTSIVTDPAERGPLVVSSLRRVGGSTVLRFESVTDREAAETLRGTLLVVDATGLPDLDDDDDFYDHQLIGLGAQLTGEDEPFGVVVDVLHLPGNDVLTVRTDRVAAGEVLVPFVRAIVPVVDVAGGTVTIDPPDGLFE